MNAHTAGFDAIRAEDSDTRYVIAERADQQAIQHDETILHEQKEIRTVLDSMPNSVVLLNRERQIVFANQELLNTLDVEGDEDILGPRPGEMINCIRATEGPGGCGTTESCRYCGSNLPIIECIKTGKSVTNECRIRACSKGGSESLDLQVRATPLDIGDQDFILVGLSDISDEKRRAALERMFFNDIIDSAGIIKGGLDMQSSAEDMDEYRDILDILPSATDRLMDDIYAQRQVVLAENNDLVVNLKEISAMSVVKAIIEQYSLHELAHGKKITTDEDSSDVTAVSDDMVLVRVLENMLKNALEASGIGDSVVLGCRDEGEHTDFFVRNTQYMPRDVQFQVFQRSFSTKGKNRGLGTYSVKLLTERYLKGAVSFKTDEQDGTTFMLKVPQTGPSSNDHKTFECSL